MTPSSYSIAVVIPFYNEADNVALLLAEVKNALVDQPQYEIVVVDDGSSDDTYNRLLALRKDIHNLKIIKHRSNYGQSAAIVSGVRAATLEWIITLDGDGQNDPADMKNLLQALSAQPVHGRPVLVVGNRAKRRDNMLRKLSSRIANKVRASLLQDDCPDTGCSLKLFRREDFLQLPHFNHIHRFLPALFRRAGGNVINVPVSHRPRLHGQSKYGVMNRLWVGIIDLVGVMWLIRRPCCPEVKENS